MKFIKTFFISLVLAVASVGAFAGDLTNFAENRIIDALIRGQSLGAPATWHIALDTVACTEAGGGTLAQEYLVKAMLRTVQGREEPVEVMIKVVAD
jgi:hypothetical protein